MNHITRALTAAKELCDILSEYDEDDLLALDADAHPPSAISVYRDALKNRLASAEVSAALAQPEPVEMRRENIKLLTDKYAAACSSFARKIALKGRDDSMSPLAVEAGDLRAELHAAIDAMAQPEQVELTDEQIKELLPYSWPWGIEVVRSILAAAKGGAL